MSPTCSAVILPCSSSSSTSRRAASIACTQPARYRNVPVRFVRPCLRQQAGTALHVDGHQRQGKHQLTPKAGSQNSVRWRITPSPPSLLAFLPIMRAFKSLLVEIGFRGGGGGDSGVRRSAATAGKCTAKPRAPHSSQLVRHRAQRVPLYTSCTRTAASLRMRSTNARRA